VNAFVCNIQSVHSHRSRENNRLIDGCYAATVSAWCHQCARTNAQHYPAQTQHHISATDPLMNPQYVKLSLQPPDMKVTYCLWKISVFRDLTPCSVVKVYRHFGRSCCLLHLGRRIHIDADKSTLWKVGTFLPTTRHLIPEYSKDTMGDYAEVRWMECVIFRNENGTSFLSLPGYTQWDLLRWPFRINATGLTSSAFQDIRNGTFFECLPGYTQRDLLRVPSRIYATGLTSSAFQDIRNGTYFECLPGYTQRDLLRVPSRIYATGLTSWAFQDIRNGTYFECLPGYTQRDLLRAPSRIYATGLTSWAFQD